VRGWGRFAAWVALGALLGLATLSLNIAFALVIVGIVVFAGRRQPAAFGVLTGAGLLALWAAWLNATTDELSYVPWLVAAFVLVTAGFVSRAFVGRERAPHTSRAL
jgi:hypothetical protein